MKSLLHKPQNVFFVKEWGLSVYIGDMIKGIRNIEVESIKSKHQMDLNKVKKKEKTYIIFHR